MGQLEKFGQAAGMENRLKGVQLDEDENIKYARAYSLFKIGQYPEAEIYLSQSIDSKIFTKAVELRKIMQGCATQTWRCQ